MMCSNPKEVWPKNKAVTVPCGKCISCLSNRRVDWSFRLQQEWKHSKSASFLTLTYDRKHMPEHWQLSKRDLQLFFKKLRQHEKQKGIRYYAVGEYGSKTNRPHYHILLFNSISSESEIKKIWKKGIIHAGKVSAASVSYCLKYIVQPELSCGKKTKPFSLMSRGYGLGAKYLTDQMVAWHRSGDKNYTMVNNQQTRLPRFYREKIWYHQTDRERVSLASKWFAIKKARLELRFYVNRFGIEKAKTRMSESRNAALSRIKIKVAFTQTL